MEYAAKDLAKELGMSSATLSMWQSRHADFPAPQYSNPDGSVRLWSEEGRLAVLEWQASRQGAQLRRLEEQRETVQRRIAALQGRAGN